MKRLTNLGMILALTLSVFAAQTHAGAMSNDSRREAELSNEAGSEDEDDEKTKSKAGPLVTFYANMLGGCRNMIVPRRKSPSNRLVSATTTCGGLALTGFPAAVLSSTGDVGLALTSVSVHEFNQWQKSTLVAAAPYAADREAKRLPDSTGATRLAAADEILERAGITDEHKRNQVMVDFASSVSGQ